MKYLNLSAEVVGEHRYHLMRVWDHHLPALSIGMLNPSTADGRTDDPTIRKCVGFAKRFGCGSIDVWNAYSYRTSSPKALRAAGYPNGPVADSWIIWLLGNPPRVPIGRLVFAWGGKIQPERARQIEHIAAEVCNVPPEALKLNADGTPAHPLYLPYTSGPVPYHGQS